MTVILPQTTDTLNSPSHSFLHRVVSIDTSSPESSIDVQADGSVVFIDGITATVFITDGGLSTDFVKGDGSLDSTTYVSGTPWTSEGYLTTETDPVVGAITGIVKANGAGVISSAVAGTDYQAPLTFGIANDNAVEIDMVGVADNDYAKFTANGLEGRSYTEVKQDLDLEIGTDIPALTHASQHAVGGADSVFPADPNADRYLKWDDTLGEVIWAEVSAGGGDVSKVGTPADNQVAVWTGDGTVEGDTHLKWNGSSNTFEIEDSLGDGLLTISPTFSQIGGENNWIDINNGGTSGIDITYDDSFKIQSISKSYGGLLDFSGITTSDKTFTFPNLTGNIVTDNATQTLTNKTIDADNNTLSNIEVDNLKAGVLDTDLSSVSASDDTIPSAKATKAAIDAKMANPMTTQGDVIYGGASGTPTRLPKGTASQVLTMNAGATAPEWADAGVVSLLNFYTGMSTTLQIAAGVTNYVSIFSGYQVTTSFGNNVNKKVPFNGTLSKLAISAYINSSTTGSTVFTLVKNGVDTSLTVTVPNGSLATISDNINSVSVSADDEVAIKAVNGQDTTFFCGLGSIVYSIS